MQNVCQSPYSWSHFDKFKENVGTYSEEQGEQLHQDILDFEHPYQGQYNKHMMSDYIWGLLWESNLQYTWKYRESHSLLNLFQ